MYTRIVKFKFAESLSQSKRADFLASLTSACERESSLPHNYFKISTSRDGECRIDFTMPSAFNASKVELQAAEREGILVVVKPEQFY